MTKEITAAQPDPTVTPKLAKTATITLTAHGSRLTLTALRGRDGTASSFVTTTDADKKTSRGMTATYKSFDEAKAAIATSAAKAEKLGWTRRVAGRGFVAKPDAFNTIPAAPKAGKK